VILISAESKDSFLASVMPRMWGHKEGVQDLGTTTVTVLRLAQLRVAVLMELEADWRDSWKEEKMLLV